MGESLTSPLDDSCVFVLKQDQDLNQDEDLRVLVLFITIVHTEVL